MDFMKTGGPAFPISVDIETVTYYGMSIRDYFAANALQGLLASHGLSFDPNYIDKFAKTAYDYADALLKQKELK